MAGKHMFVFVCRGPLVLVAVSKSKLSESQVTAPYICIIMHMWVFVNFVPIQCFALQE